MKNKVYEKLYSEKKDVKLEKAKVQLARWQELVDKSDMIQAEFFGGLQEVREGLTPLANGIRYMEDAQNGMGLVVEELDEMMFQIKDLGLDVPSELQDEYNVLKQMYEADVYTLNNNYEAIEQILSRMQGIN